MLQRLKAWVGKIAREHGSPGKLWVACIVGAVIGSTPFFGLHLLLCIGAAVALRLNRVAVYAAANISIPPLAPFLAAACIEVGARLLTGRSAPISGVAREEALSHPWSLAGVVFASWLVGAVVVGGAIGVVLGAIVFATARAREERSPTPSDPFDAAVLETRARFSHAPIAIRQYVRWKLALDPVYRAIAAELVDGVEVVDLGTGLGLLPILLCLLGSKRTARGVDWDEAKIEHGKKACEGLPITLARDDVRTFAPETCDAITLVDVLHYFDDDTQRAILARACASLRDDGVLLVREEDRGRRGAWWTSMLERIAVAMRWNRSAERPRFRRADAIGDDLRALGLAVDVIEVAGPLHPGNVLLRARKARFHA